MNDDKRVLVIYTGGTIGMVRGPKGYHPEPGYLRATLERMPRLHEGGDDGLILPPSRVGRRTHYEIHEYEPLVDSANMGLSDWVRIARDIEKHYDDFDAFVILHGTDTMAYTASALSFMLDNLAKTVVLTGSQIPLSHVRNDGVDNFVGALMIAAHYEIPEVGVYFRDRLLRGNRCQKVDAEGFDAFRSGNLPPLARIGTHIDVAWHLVRTPQQRPFKVRPIATEHVAAIRLFPGISAETLDRLLRPPLRGVVLETYGTGNGPDNRPELHRILREATDAGIVIVNVTQCHRGAVKPQYAAGSALWDAGLVGGADMTPEAALTKLAWLLSQVGDTNEVRRLMPVDLRGELTPVDQPKHYSFRERGFIQQVARTLDTADATEQVGRAIWPVLTCAAARDGDLALLQRMQASGADLRWADVDDRTPLHLAAAEGHEAVVAWLLTQGADANAEDRRGLTPLDEAELARQAATTRLLRDHGALPGVRERLREHVARGDAEAVLAWLHGGADPSTDDPD